MTPDHEPMTTRDIVLSVVAGALMAPVIYGLLVFWLGAA